MMGFGWFGISTLWLVPLVWRVVARKLSGDTGVGRGTLRVWLGTLAVLCASATLEALTGGKAPDATSGGSAGRALASLAGNLFGWTGALLLMLGVLALAAPMVFGESWRSLLRARPSRQSRDADPGVADPVPPPFPQSPRDFQRDVASDLPRETERREPTYTSPHAPAPSPRHRTFEAVSARRQPAWQPPPRTRESPPQPGELWLQPAATPMPRAPAVAAAAPKPASVSVPVSAPAPVPAPAPAPVAQAAAPRPVPARGTVISSPFHRPQDGLRAAVTTLPAVAAPQPAVAKAEPESVAETVMETVAAPLAEATAQAEARTDSRPEAVTLAEAVEAVEVMEAEAAEPELKVVPADVFPDAVAVADETDAAEARPAPVEPAVDEGAVTLEDIRQEALALLAELQALSRRTAMVAPAAAAPTPVVAAAGEGASEPLESAAVQVEAGEVEVTAVPVVAEECEPAHVSDPTEAVEAGDIAPAGVGELVDAAATEVAGPEAIEADQLIGGVDFALAETVEVAGAVEVVEAAEVVETSESPFENARRPRESGGPVSLPAPEKSLDPRFRGDDEWDCANFQTGSEPVEPAEAAIAPSVAPEAIEPPAVVEASAEPAEAVDAPLAEPPVPEETALAGLVESADIAPVEAAEPSDSAPADAPEPEAIETAAAVETAPAGETTPVEAPRPKPRIVLPAVVGRVVPLAAAAPVVAPPPPPPPRVVDYRLPGHDLLEPATDPTESVPETALGQTGELIAQRLAEFKVPVTVAGASAGPVITRFEVEPAMGVRGAQVVGLMKDLARALGVSSIRVVETIPGKTCMGLELPNAKRQMIRLSEIVSAASFELHSSRLVLAMGKDITGHPVVTDLARAPHLLVAGTTGSGKSVAVNAMILSMLYKATPEEVRLIMIDPKMLELSVYEGIPHLLAPVVTDMKQAAHALNWCVGEMEKRYRLMSALGVRNLAAYNQKIRAAEAAEQKVPNPFSLTPDAPEPLSKLPLIVVVIDELADLMMVAGKKIEELIARLAQKARAAGIHLILATQRPSVDVITGLIKANIPTRVAFQVSSKIDSRTILDQMGAESLLGQGDMLFLPPGTGYPQRVHGAFVADDEVHRVVEHWKQFGEPDYDEAILAGDAAEGVADLFGDGSGGDGEADPLYDEAAQFVIGSRRASISAVQRQLRIGYNRAARLIEQMEAAGLVSPMGRNGTREVIVPGPAD